MTLNSLNVLAVTCSADRKQASVYGQARVDGEGSHFFRVQVTDTADPDRHKDTDGILVDTGYYSGEKPLEGGNVQIR